MSAELEHLWSRVHRELARAVGDETHRIWLDSLRARELAGGRLTVEAPTATRSWVGDRFGGVIRACVAQVLGEDVEVELTSTSELSRERDAAAGRGRRQRERALAHAHTLPNPKLTFDQFVIGDCNRLAHAAALTVAEMPGGAYNPLFICGPPGVGKTHLLNSIAVLLLAHDPGLAVRVTTGETFTNEFLEALSDRRTDAFKASFRDVDVLLVDDVQFLERKTRTEEEFFHTFNALYDGGRQIVLSSDRPPRDLQALEDRLRARFACGLVADIQPPDFSTRMAILRKRAHHDEIELADESALQAIAERIPDNVRAIEGALIRIVAFASLTRRAITGELARDVLDSIYPDARGGRQRAGAPTIAEISQLTCAQFDITHDELISASRRACIALPRQVAMYLARELTDESLPTIGRMFGDRDHTTVLHAHRRTAARIASDATVRRTVDNLTQRLRNADDTSQLDRSG